MMTDRRFTLSLATASALIAFTMVPARADEGATAVKPANAIAKVHTAANLDVPALRSSKVPVPVGRMHHRKVVAATPRSVSAPAGLVRVAYRPTTETACGNRVCGAPIVLYIGITY
jgi:hypothetical protein